MLIQMMELLSVKKEGVYIDATVGSGGHAKALLERLGVDGRLLGIDRDEDAIKRTEKRLLDREGQCQLLLGNFSDIKGLAQKARVKEVDGIVMDLGMSSEQIDQGDRGFSFMHEGLLDMRMDRTQAVTAEKIVNTYDRGEIADILWNFGEEKASSRVANRIVLARQKGRIKTTKELAQIVSDAKGGRRGRIHPATKTFQALRIAVNRELESLSKGLEEAVGLLREGGRLAVISYHSLEDRNVKQCFSQHVGRWESLNEGGSRWKGSMPVAQWITHTFVVPDQEEVQQNPRARSSKLRVIERIKNAEEKKTKTK